MTATPVARIARLTQSDWQLFATVRLRALSDDLGTESAQYRQEAAFTAAHWRRRLRQHAQFVALSGDQTVGLVGAQQQKPDIVYLYSLWLDPAARGQGLARPLVSAVIDWARERNATAVTLRVAADNAVARGVYEGLGFVADTITADDGEIAMSVRVR